MSILSEEKIEQLFKSMHGFPYPNDLYAFARAIEAAVLEAQGKQEPVAYVVDRDACMVWWNDKFTHISQAPKKGTPLYAAPVVQPFEDFFPDACRLAMELECLLLSCNDNAAVSKWWDSAHEALEQHRELIAAAEGNP